MSDAGCTKNMREGACGQMKSSQSPSITLDLSAQLGNSSFPPETPPLPPIEIGDPKFDPYAKGGSGNGDSSFGAGREWKR